MTQEKKAGLLKQLVGLTRPDLMYMISDLSRSSSKTPDERLMVARALLKRVREPVKSIVYPSSDSSNTEKLDLVCFIDASYNQNTVSGVRFAVRGSICGLRCRQSMFPHPVDKCRN